MGSSPTVDRRRRRGQRRLERPRGHPTVQLGSASTTATHGVPNCSITSMASDGVAPGDDRRPDDRGDVGNRAQRQPAQTSLASEERRHELVGRRARGVRRGWRTVRDAADVHDRHSIGELDRLVDVVGHDDDRLVHRGLQRQQIVLEPGANDRIDRAVRLVHQQDRRIGGERTGDAGTLLLSARQRRRVPIEQVQVESRRVRRVRRSVRRSDRDPSRATRAPRRCCVAPCDGGTGRSAGSRTRCSDGVRGPAAIVGRRRAP